VLCPQTQVTSCEVPPHTLVEPCTASSNPAQKNSYKNPKDAAAVCTGHKPLPAGPAVLAIMLFSCISTLLHMPATGECMHVCRRLAHMCVAADGFQLPSMVAHQSLSHAVAASLLFCVTAGGLHLLQLCTRYVHTTCKLELL
jgi:hypothetical protein